MSANQEAYVRFMRLMGWLAVSCTSALVVFSTYGRVSPWGV